MALGPEDRTGLLLDAYALAKAGHPSMPPTALLTLVGAYKDEVDATVWEALESVLLGLDKLLLAASSSNGSLRDQFVSFAARLVRPAAAKVGWEASPSDPFLGKLLRATLVRLQAHFCASDPEVSAKAKELWDEFFALAPGAVSPNLPADFKIPVFKIVLKNCSTGAAFEQLLALLPSLATNAERKAVYMTLGSAPQPHLKKRVLEWAVSGEIKLQDFFYPIGSVSQSSPEGLAMAWAFFQERFDAIHGMVCKASASLMDAAIVYSVAGFATEAKAAEIEAFFTDPATGQPRLPQSNRKIQQTVEGMRTSAKFLERILASDIAAVLA